MSHSDFQYYLERELREFVPVSTIVRIPNPVPGQFGIETSFWIISYLYRRLYRLVYTVNMYLYRLVNRNMKLSVEHILY